MFSKCFLLGMVAEGAELIPVTLDTIHPGWDASRKTIQPYFFCRLLYFAFFFFVTLTLNELMKLTFLNNPSYVHAVLLYKLCLADMKPNKASILYNVCKALLCTASRRWRWCLYVLADDGVYLCRSSTFPQASFRKLVWHSLCMPLSALESSTWRSL